MDKIERAGYIKKLIKLYRKQGKSAKEARQLAGEAMRLMAQGKEWQDKAQRKADKLQRYVSKCIVETIEGVDVITLPAKNTRRTYKNNGCRIASKAKTISNALWMDVAQGKGRSKAIYIGQTSDNLAMTVTVSADNVRQARHLRACNLVIARRYCKRQEEKS
jgi:gas vesicle protein